MWICRNIWLRNYKLPQKLSVLSTRTPQDYISTKLKNIKVKAQNTIHPVPLSLPVLGAEISFQDPGPECLPELFVARVQGLKAGAHGAS